MYPILIFTLYKVSSSTKFIVSEDSWNSYKNKVQWC